MTKPITAFSAAVFALALAATGCSRSGEADLDPPSAAETGRFGDVDQRRLDAAEEEPGNWFTNGRDAAGSYHSPLAQIDASTVQRLGFAWDYQLGTSRGQEATPVVIDGVMYAVGNWGRVYALDAATGKELWTYDPEVDGQYGRYACCDVVQRGLAVWKRRVIVGSTDGFLHSIDARTGKRVWKVDMLPAGARAAHEPYTSSGSPQIAGDRVVIGNGGADYGVRGFVAAFDIASGRLAWRFYTVPRDPKLGPQDGRHLDAAVKTWDPSGSWTRYGGGGTAWDGMAYDAKLGLLYVGTGNASPYSYAERSPRGGDNLYLASILAIRADTGELAWHFQQVPGERWDYTATQKFILADISIAGRPRQVIMQAPKNGFFYILDRKTGEFLSGKPFIPLNWAKGLDPKGRPILSSASEYENGPKLIFPGFAGGHNWQPMARDPSSGIVYIPSYETPLVYVDTRKRPIGKIPGLYNTYPVPPELYDPVALKSDLGDLPPLAELMATAPGPAKWNNVLRAFDPVTGRVLWKRTSSQVMASGVMSTAGNLLFHGRPDGSLEIYAADSGRLIRRIQTGSSIMAAPMTYAVRGIQYVAVITGYGGGGGFSFPKYSAAYQRGNQNRIIAFRLDGGEVPMPPLVHRGPVPTPPAYPTPRAAVERGRVQFLKNCSGCHSFGPGLVPDLRRLSPDAHRIFDKIVLEGLLAANGMGRFDDVLSPSDVHDIHAYIVDKARRSAGRTDDVGYNPKAQ